MGRGIVAEELFQDNIVKIAKAKKFAIGLLIGQNSLEKDVLVHLAPNPPPVQDEEEVKIADAIGTVQESLITQHARQVLRMLPGGLEVLGIYVATSQNDFGSASSRTKLRNLLVSISRIRSKLCLGLADPQVSSQRLILHICTKSAQYSMHSVDVSQAVSVISPAEALKIQKGGLRWHQISCSYQMDVNLWLPAKLCNASLHQQLQSQLTPWAESLMSSLVLIDGQLGEDDALLDPTVEDKPSGKKKGRGAAMMMDLAPPRVFTAEVIDFGGSQEQPAINMKSEVLGAVRLSGLVSGRAFLQGKATLAEARQAILTDLLRSMSARWEMHCDSLVEEQPPQTSTAPPVLHEPPRRVFLEAGGLPVSLCDYLFPGDSKGDAVLSATDLFGVNVLEDNVDDTIETFADVSTVIGASRGSSECGSEGGMMEDRMREVMEGRERSFGEVCSPLYAVLGIIVAMVAVGGAYLSATSGSVS